MAEDRSHSHARRIPAPDTQTTDQASSTWAETVHLTPESRFRPRVDGGRDETFRVNFVGGLNADEMRALVKLLLEIQDQQPDVGLIALTKVEFIEPDTLEYRYWSGKPHGARLDRMFELWQSMNLIHPIYTVDGIQYPWLGPLDRASNSSQAESDDEL